jgi:hypothetical protein
MVYPKVYYRGNEKKIWSGLYLETQVEFDRWLAGQKPKYAEAVTSVNNGPLPTTVAGKSDSTKPASEVKTTVEPKVNL